MALDPAERGSPDPAMRTGRPPEPRPSRAVLLGTALLCLVAADAGAAITGADLMAPSANPLAVRVEFSTDELVTPRVRVTGPDGSWTVPASGIESVSPGTRHRVLVLGLEAEASYTLELSDAGEDLAPVELGYAAPALPVTFPSLEPSTVLPAERSPGFVLMAVNDVLGGRSWVVLLDAEGDPRWLWGADGPSNDGVTGMRWRPGGGVAYVTFDWTRLRLIEPDGSLAEVPAASLGLDSFHHDVQLTPAGNLLTVSSTLTAYDEFPDEPFSIHLVGEVLSEISPDGATILRQWDLPSSLDPFRSVGNGSFWRSTYPGVPRLREWGHVNGFYYDGSDDGIVVSILAQEALVEIDAATGELRWIIGVDRPESSADDSWPFLARIGPGGDAEERRHSAQALDGDRLYYYANGNGATGASGRGIEIDEDTLTYTEVFTWNDPIWGPIGGDCDVLPDGNALILDGSASGGQRLVEVRAGDGAKVFELTVPGSTTFNVHALSAPPGMAASDLPTLLYPPGLFADGFESGGTCAWALSAPGGCEAR